MKPLFGVDYSASRPSSVAALVQADVRFVCRYVAALNGSFNLTHTEAANLRRHGIPIVAVFEQAPNQALKGHLQGVKDAQAARVAASQAGLPASTAVYFAVDFDATPADQAAINSYLQGAASELGKRRVGVYGGYWVVKRALDAGVCRYGWQTAAWSGGQWDPRAHIRQVKNGQKVAGADVDINYAYYRDFGQFPAPFLPVSDAVKRFRLRAWILLQRRHGWSWPRIKKGWRFKAFKRLGGK